MNEARNLAIGRAALILCASLAPRAGVLAQTDLLPCWNDGPGQPALQIFCGINIQLPKGRG